MAPMEKIGQIHLMMLRVDSILDSNEIYEILYKIETTNDM